MLTDAPVCPACGAEEGVIGPGTRVHYARITCGQCGRFLCWLPKPKEHEMAEKVKPPSAPMMTEAPEPEPDGVLIDDIADPVTPPEVLSPPASQPDPPTPAYAEHEALLMGFCQALQGRLQAFMLDEHNGLMRTLDATLVAMRKWVETVGQQNEHAQYTLGDALKTLSLTPPYQCSITAVSPQGWPVTISVAKQDAGALVQALPELCAWLQSQGYTADEVRV